VVALEPGWAIDESALASATPEQASAVVAALARFIADTATPAQESRAVSAWLAAVRSEATAREPTTQERWH
jgi:hypothetical protein